MPTRTRAGASARKPSRRRAPPRKTAPARKSTPRRRALVIRRQAPLREDDPSAKKTGRRRNYYTAEFLAEAKRRIEQTLQSTTAIAGDLGMDKSVLGRLVVSEGWVRPDGSLRLRSLSPVMRIAAAVDAMVGAASPPPERGRACPGLDPGSASEASRVGVIEPASTPTPTLPLAGGGSPTESPAPDMIERLESAVIRELAIVERMRASMRDEPLRPMDAERTARTLSVLTETLAKLRRLRLGSAPQSGSIENDNDYPADIDAFRHEFARRVDAFIASRADAGGAAAAGPAGRSDPV